MSLRDPAGVATGLPIDETAAFDRALQPARVYELARAADEDDLIEMFRQARSLNQNSWIAMAIVCGESTDRVGDDRRGYRRLARALECHKSEVVRLVGVYRGIIRPRIERDGADAKFEIQQMVYYTLACEAARAAPPSQQVTPLELLERAEARRSAERTVNGTERAPRYTSREFRDELIAEGYIRRGPAALADGAEQCLDALRIFSEQPDDVVERAAHLAMPEERRWRNVIDEARARLDQFERELDVERAHIEQQMSRSVG